MSNIRFNYLFRDADNYKLFGSEVFSNKGRLPLAVIKDVIKSSLIDRKFFYPSEWRLPFLTAEDGWGMMETDWCEFESVELTKDEVTMGRVEDWLKVVGMGR